MSEQNNNCEQCGNNKEPNGECYDCEYTRECGVCYESKSDFTNGLNCTHKVCDDCSVRLTRCPFCRQPWTETNPVRAINNLRRMYRMTEQRMLAGGEHHPDRETTEQLMLIILERIEEIKNITHYQVRTDNGEFIYDNIGEFDFHTEEEAREIFEGTKNNPEYDYLHLTKTSAFLEDDWNELFEDEYYPEVITVAEWYRDEGDNPANYCPQCTYALGCCKCNYPEDYEEEQNEL